jgi:hypothetical protein
MIENQIIINNTPVQIKEYNDMRVVTLKDIDAVHGRPDGTARKRFNDNKDHFIEGEDFFKVCASEIRTRKIIEISAKAQEDVTFITESGYLMLVKSFTDDLAWNVQRQLVNSYFRVHKIASPTSQLDVLANMATIITGAIDNMKQQEERLKAVEEKQNAQEEQLDKVRDAYEITSYNWRTEAPKTVAKIARATNIPISRVWLETYNALETKAHCTLKTRRENKKQRMLENGCTPTQAKTVCNLDVIAEDAKLKEIYIGILRDMRFKAGV